MTDPRLPGGIVVILLSSPGALGAVPAAAPPEGVHLEVGLRVGISSPIRFSDYGFQPSDLISVAFPVGIELGVRLERFFVGVLGQVAFGAGDCPEHTSSCSTRTYEVGPEAIYLFNPGEPVAFWLGLGGGWQTLHWTTVDPSTLSAPNGREFTSKSSGWFVELQAGLDARVERVFRFGPWLSFTVGAVHSGAPPSVVNGWLAGGARIALDF